MPPLTRRELLGAGIAALSLRAGGGQAESAAPRPRPDRPWLLWYRRPARYWVEALPVGNGRLGGMVFGGTGVERLQLNEDTLWAGGPYDPAHPDALAALPEVRKLLRAGRYAEAQELAGARSMARPLRQMSYQTLGSLELLTPTAEGCAEYRRWLDLERACAVTEWRAAGGTVRRRIYASAADGVLVVEFDVDGGLELAVRFTAGEAAPAGGELWLRGRNREQHGIPGQLEYAAAVKALDGEARARNGKGELRVTAAGPLTLLVAARTSYRGWNDPGGDPAARVREDLDRAAAHGRAGLFERHLEEHARLFGGFAIDLGADPFPDIPTDERIRYSHERERDDPYLAALYVQYARYLLLASSRPGTQPANLQGLWNDSDDPPWGSKYTININTEMNYWPAEPMGLGECTEPLIRMAEELAESGARTARVNYGARGWVTHHNTDLWRASAPIDGAFWGLWPTGGAWLCKHLWDRWDYSRERIVLERIYPVMKGAARFFLDTLVEMPDGGLVTSPSLSPENAHRPGISLCEGPAMDRQILRELFANVIEASELLDADHSLREELAAARERLPPDRIGRAGQLQEWLEDWDLEAPELQHRHVSHLYAVHPGHAIGSETPALKAAARRSLAIRGDDATGWGIGWRINLWARLGEPERAYTVLRKLLGPERSYPNLFDAHPPFQIDGNFGGAAGVLEMLVRDRPRRLDLLPAVPAAWPQGEVDGVRLRGGLRLRLRWREARLAEARFSATTAITREVSCGGETRNVSLQPGETYVWH